jgi:hypothetical protein
MDQWRGWHLSPPLFRIIAGLFPTYRRIIAAFYPLDFAGK